MMTNIRRLIIIFVYLYCCFPLYVADCRSGFFGRSCQYACNCNTPCNATSGLCHDGCRIGWRGKSCQKQNIALGKLTYQPDTRSGFTSGNAVDGNTNGDLFGNGTCMHTRKHPGGASHAAWWRVDLGAVIPIKSVRIYDRIDGLDKQRMVGYEIYAVNSTILEEGYQCYKRRDNLPTDSLHRIYDQNCTLPTRYLYVYLEKFEAVLDFCEVEVYVCRHGTYGNDCEHQCGYCENDDICDQNNGDCPRGCAAGWQGQNCQQACADGYYGKNCVNSCGHCDLNEVCNKVDGTCPSGCQPGFTGDVCKTKCPDRTYGTNCHLQCGHCFNNNECDSQTGRCDQGCYPGYKTQYCNQTCGNLRYGMECTNNCGNCINGVQCNSVTGQCETGCDPGYYGPLCQQACVNRTYGVDCGNECGKCVDGEQFNATTGHCEKGCANGYIPPLCKEVCVLGTYGKNCSNTCHNCLNQECRHTDGICKTCNDGWQGATCEQICDLGTYGVNCNSSCQNCLNNTCRHTDGMCNSCSGEWQGPMCGQKTNQSQSQGFFNEPIAKILIVIPVLLVVLMVAVAGVIIHKRRTQSKKEPAMEGTHIFGSKSGQTSFRRDETHIDCSDSGHTDGMQLHLIRNMESDKRVETTASNACDSSVEVQRERSMPTASSEYLDMKPISVVNHAYCVERESKAVEVYCDMSNLQAEINTQYDMENIHEVAATHYDTPKVHGVATTQSSLPIVQKMDTKHDDIQNESDPANQDPINKILSENY